MRGLVGRSRVWLSVVLAACGPSVAVDDAGGSAGSGDTSGTGASITTVATVTSIDVTSSADAASGGVCFVVHDGDLEVTGAVLPGEHACLVEVTGQLLVRDTDLVDLTEFAMLQRVGGLSITDNPQLQSLVGLEALRDLGSLWVAGNPALTSVAGFSGDIVLTDPDLPSVGFVDNDALPNLDGLFGVSSVAAGNLVQLQLSGNAQLVDAGGIAPFTTLGDALFVVIFDCPALVTLGNPYGASQLAGVALVELPALQDITALSDVQELVTLEIAAAHALPTLGGLDNLQRVGARLEIGSCSAWDGNDALASVTLPSLVEAGELRIMGNDGVLTLDGLSTLVSVGDVHVVDNVSLPTSDAQAWSEMLPVHGAIEICGNAGGTPCDGGCPIPE